MQKFTLNRVSKADRKQMQS